MQSLIKKIQGDKVIWMVALFLSILSLLAVYSSISSLAYKANDNSFKFLVKHLFMLVMGLLAMFTVHRMQFKYFSRISQVMIWVAGFMLLFTLVFGVNINDARRWINIPFVNMTFQTSDFAKIILIIYVARLLNANRTFLHDFRKGVIPILIPIAAICGLILPADFSTAVLLFLVCFVLMAVGGVPLRHMMKIVGAGVAVLVLIVLIGKASPGTFTRLDTWISRVENFTNDDSSGNYQIDLAQVAIYQGGLLPSGPGSGSSRNYLPHPYSDMIYAFIIEEYGAIFGGLGVLMLYLIFMYRSIRTANRCPKHFGGLMAMGLASLLVLQALINMAVAVNLIPTTGQPLPLVSMGGTSIIFTCISIGIILSVSRSVYNEEEWMRENSHDPTNKANGNYVVA